MCKVISKLGNDSASANITIVESNEIITGMPASTERAYVSSESPIRISVSTEGANTSSSTSTSTTGTSHLVKCAEKEKTFCVNGGECFMVKDLSNPSRYLCKCPNEFTGDRCQNYVMASFYSTSTPFCLCLNRSMLSRCCFLVAASPLRFHLELDVCPGLILTASACRMRTLTNAIVSPPLFVTSWL